MVQASAKRRARKRAKDKVVRSALVLLASGERKGKGKEEIEIREVVEETKRRKKQEGSQMRKEKGQAREPREKRTRNANCETTGCSVGELGGLAICAFLLSLFCCLRCFSCFAFLPFGLLLCLFLVRFFVAMVARGEGRGEESTLGHGPMSKEKRTRKESAL